MTPTVVPIYAALLGLIFVVLSIRVADMRRTTQIALGPGGNRMLERRIRVQGNFAEFVPISLILLILVEMQGWSRWLVHLLCAAVLVARIVHAYGVGREPEDIRFRASAVMTNALVIIVAAVLLLYGAFR